MKYKIVERFKDKYTKEIYKKDAIVEFSKERANEILKVGKYIEPIKKTRKKAEKSE